VNRNSLIALVAVFGALLALYFLTKSDPTENTRDSAKMVAAYDASRVARIRIDNVERNEKVVLAKGAGDDWQMEEPLRVPADSVMARYITTYFTDYTGAPMGEAVKLDQLGLDKPRAIVEFEMQAKEKSPAEKIVAKIGSDDMKKEKIFLQVDNKVFKAPRTLYNSIAKPHDEFRDRRVFTLSQAEIGEVEFGKPDSKIALKLEDGQWRFTAPFKGRADAALAQKVVNLAGLRVGAFENDSPSPDIQQYGQQFGLEPPVYVVEFKTKQKTEQLRVGKANAERTYIQRAGVNQIWSVETGELQSIMKPAEELRDPVVAAAFSNEKVALLRWKLGASELEFSRDAITQEIKLTKPREGAADRDAFESLLKSLNGLKADSLVSSVGANLADFGLSPPAGELELKLKDASQSLRFEIGATRPEGTFLRRPGDDYLLRVPAAVFAGFSKPYTEFLARDLIHISSYDPGHVEIDFSNAPGVPSPNAKLTFKRNEANKWVRGEETEENAQFNELSDALWHARGTAVLAVESAPAALATPTIEARVYRRLYNNPKGDDKEKDRLATMRFAQLPDGAWLAIGFTGKEMTGGHAMAISPEVPSKLLVLAGAPESKPASAPASSPATIPNKQ
jgi:hypothetical protein